MAVFTKDGMVHSSHYHRYFEDYMEIYETDEEGKRRIRRVYVGQYYSLEGGGKKRTMLKCVYALLYLLALGLYVAATSMPSASNICKPVQLPVFAGIVMLLFYGCVLVSYISRPAEMTVWEYKSGPLRVLKLSRWVLVLQGLYLLATAVYMIIARGWELNGQILTLGFGIMSVLPMAAINRIEAKQHYNTRTSDEEMIRAGHYID